MAAGLGNALGGLAVEGDLGAVHDHVIAFHQGSGLLDLVYIDFNHVDPAVVEPLGHFAGFLVVVVPDGDGVKGPVLDQVQNSFPADAAGGAKAEYFHVVTSP